MGCSLRACVAFGIFLAILDILHGLGSLGFYGYRFIANYFWLCPRDLPIEVCHNKDYIYRQMFTMRTYIGLGEGAITPIFNIVFIISLVKHMPCMVWMWLIKSFGIIGINIFYISSWLIRRESFANINFEKQEYEHHFLMVGAGLTIFQVMLMILFCIVSGIFTYKVSEDRTRSRRSLHPRSPSFRRKNGRPSAPSMPDYDDEDIPSYLNPTLNDSTNKLPYPGSNNSIDNMSVSETLRQPTTV